jgi:poly(A) polymerase
MEIKQKSLHLLTRCLSYSEGVLALLRSLIPSFIRRCIKENNTERTDFECQLKPFGSFGLGGHITGGDIDLVLLAPLAIRRRDFFEFFSKLLKSEPIICEVEVMLNNRWMKCND